MKIFIISLLFTAFLLNAETLKAQTTEPKVKTDTIQVKGNCSMCKQKIEGALEVGGVLYANWDPDEKRLIVRYKTRKINNDTIQRLVASVGYDTEKYRADDRVYDELHHCCQYERD